MQRLHVWHAESGIAGFSGILYIHTCQQTSSSRNADTGVAHLLPRHISIEPAGPPPPAGFLLRAHVSSAWGRVIQARHECLWHIGRHLRRKESFKLGIRACELIPVGFRAFCDQHLSHADVLGDACSRPDAARGKQPSVLAQVEKNEAVSA